MRGGGRVRGARAECGVGRVGLRYYYGPQAKRGKQRVGGLPTEAVVVVVVTATPAQFCSRRLRPPGPWGAPTPGPGWGSGPGSRRTAAPAPRWPPPPPPPPRWTRTRRRTRTRPGRRNRWSRRAVASSGGPGWRNPTSLAAAAGERRQERGGSQRDALRTVT